jgi:hypothetical protein
MNATAIISLAKKTPLFALIPGPLRNIFHHLSYVDYLSNYIRITRKYLQGFKPSYGQPANKTGPCPYNRDKAPVIDIKIILDLL